MGVLDVINPVQYADDIVKDTFPSDFLHRRSILIPLTDFKTPTGKVSYEIACFLFLISVQVVGL